MSEILPQNIVEAYTMASKAAMMNPELKDEAFESVSVFCENNDVCLAENSIKRNILLFWAYTNMASSKFEAGRFDETLAIWQKAKELTEDPETRIDVGFKMLETVERCRLSIPQKAKEIINICRYMQEAYQKLEDSDGLQKMEHLQASAEYLLNGTKLKH